MEYDKRWVSKDYVEVLQQLLRIATPKREFNGHAPCPWLAIGITSGKVSIERGSEPTVDVDKAKQHNKTRWATAYWYQPTMKAKELELTCKIMSDDEITVLYMHDDDSTDPLNVKLCGKYPILIVQNKKMLDTARQQLPPDYPYSFD